MSGFLDEPQAGASLSPLEAAIMDRWDAGESIEQIIRSRVFAAGTVKVTVYRFGGSSRAWEANWARKARAGCVAMTRAIAATGRGYA